MPKKYLSPKSLSLTIYPKSLSLIQPKTQIVTKSKMAAVFTCSAMFSSQKYEPLPKNLTNFENIVKQFDSHSIHTMASQKSFRADKNFVSLLSTNHVIAAMLKTIQTANRNFVSLLSTNHAIKATE
jgi:hypothetical protein